MPMNPAPFPGAVIECGIITKKAGNSMNTCPVGSSFYAIRSGDSLWTIARRFGTSVPAIASANPGLEPMNLRVGRVICIPSPGISGVRDAQALRDRLRLLWSQHVYWTRMVIMGIVFDLPDLSAANARLMQNPGDFMLLLRPFYGEANAARFAQLLTAHLSIAGELVTAAKNGDTAAAGEAERRWYRNADEIAQFLAGLNPDWSALEWQRMLYSHLAMTKAEALDMISQKYEESVAVFERIEQEALQMADHMAQGIVLQFPHSFSPA